MFSAGGGGSYWSVGAPTSSTQIIYAKSIAYDSANDYIIVGYYIRDQSSGPYGLISSFDADGNENFTFKVDTNSPSSYESLVYTVCCDSSGNIYVLADGVGNFTGVTVIKYNSSGTSLWSKKLHAASSQDKEDTFLVLNESTNTLHVSWSYNDGWSSQTSLNTSNGAFPSSSNGLTQTRRRGIPSGSDKCQFFDMDIGGSNYMLQTGKYLDYNSGPSNWRHWPETYLMNNNFTAYGSGSQNIKNTSYGPYMKGVKSFGSSTNGQYVMAGKINDPAASSPTGNEYNALISVDVDTANPAPGYLSVQHTKYWTDPTSVGNLYSICKENFSDGDMCVVGTYTNKGFLTKFDGSLNINSFGYFEGAGTGFEFSFGLRQRTMAIGANDDMYILYKDSSGSWGNTSLHVTKVPADFASIPSSNIPTGVSGKTLDFTSTTVPTASTTAAGWTWGSAADNSLSTNSPVTSTLTTSTANTPTWTTEEY